MPVFELSTVPVPITVVVLLAVVDVDVVVPRGDTVTTSAGSSDCSSKYRLMRSSCVALALKLTGGSLVCCLPNSFFMFDDLIRYYVWT